MASSAPKIAEVERRDDLAKIEQQAALLVNQIRQSKHFIAFTGAGVSTSAGIPDFRGPEGAWTLRAQGRTRTGKTTSTLKAVPTPTHMALVELQNKGILKYLVSQNCDGLHRRSGILPENISELHGNSNREYCRECGKDYIRDFRAVAKYEKTVHDHRTGRKCDLCGGALLDSIINFGESLPEEALRKAFKNAKEADLCLVLGSSLTVTPANEVPEVVGRSRRGKLVICNLQKTPLDGLADTRIFSETDILMARIMDGLGLQIPIFVLRRRLVIKYKMVDDQHQISLHGVDVDSTPVLFLQSVKLEGYRRVARAEPFLFSLRNALPPGEPLEFTLVFMGHYNEPSVTIPYECPEEVESQTVYDLHFDLQSGDWTVAKH